MLPTDEFFACCGQQPTKETRKCGVSAKFGAGWRQRAGLYWGYFRMGEGAPQQTNEETKREARTLSGLRIANETLLLWHKYTHI